MYEVADSVHTYTTLTFSPFTCRVVFGEVTFPGEWRCQTIRQLLLPQSPSGAGAQDLTKATQSAIPSPEMPGLLLDALGGSEVFLSIVHSV